MIQSFKAGRESNIIHVIFYSCENQRSEKVGDRTWSKAERLKILIELDLIEKITSNQIPMLSKMQPSNY